MFTEQKIGTLPQVHYKRKAVPCAKPCSYA